MDLNLLAKLLAIFGVVFLVLAGAVFLLSLLGFPRLPGDILVKRGNLTVYFPIVTMVLISIILTVVLNLILRR